MHKKRWLVLFAILFLYVSLMFSFIAAKPVIYSVSGNVSHKNNVTIYGIGFGVKEPAKPLLWDDFEDGLDPSSLGIITTWDGIQDIIHTNSACIDGQGCARDNLNNRDEWTWTLRIDPYNQAQYDISDYNNKFYIYRKSKRSFEVCNINYKCFRAWYNIDLSATFISPSNGAWEYNSGTCWWDSSYLCNNTSWKTEEILIQSNSNSTTANGIGRYFVDNTLLADCTSMKFREDSGAASNFWKDVYPVHSVVSNEGSPSPLAHFWVDDVYVDKTWARIIICGNKTYSNCSKNLEIQIPVSWSDNSITFTANQGSFQPGEQAYLFVIDENGTASEDYPITIGFSNNYPNCSEGRINETCYCNGALHNSGYCCTGIWDANACRIAYEGFEDGNFSDFFHAMQPSYWDSLAITSYQPHSGKYSLRGNACNGCIDPITGKQGRNRVDLNFGYTENVGVGTIFNLDSSHDSELYVKLWLKYDANFDPVDGYSSNKIWWMQFEEDTDTYYIQFRGSSLSYYDEEGYTPETYLDISPNAVDGKWHLLEIYIKYNDYNQSNGVLKIWFDAQEKVSYNNARFIISNEGKISRMCFGYFHNSATSSAGWQIDDIEIWDGLPSFKQQEGNCTDGQTQSCSTGLPGICSSGTKTCSNNQWGECIQNQNPRTEICGNGIDEDCNGEDLQCQNSSNNCASNADSDSNGVVSLQELTQYINQWLSNTDNSITINQVVEAIKEWKFGC